MKAKIYKMKLNKVNRKSNKIPENEISYDMPIGRRMIVKREDMVYADLSPVVGSEQGGIRPVIIVQNHTGNIPLILLPGLFCLSL